jgi:energy-coupling factor transport system ATP-binding protein
MPEPLIVCDQIEFSYEAPAGQHAPPVDERRVLRGISLTVCAGQHLAVIGPNGSGKSTLARHLNGLLRPQAGSVRVRGMDTRDPGCTRAIRQMVGMVFEHPESQMVATIVEEDVAFGPENLGVPHAELRQRVRDALETVDMWEARGRPPHLLSAGQKQRVAIAGVLAMRPACVVLDEATSMLDPQGRAEVARVVGALRRGGTAIVSITHVMGEAADADRVIVLQDGTIRLSGTPREVFAQPDRLRDLGLDIPPVAQLAARLGRRFPAFPVGLLTVEEMVQAVAERVPAPP